MPRRKPPSRLRYEAEHPSLTVRIPAEVKVAVVAAAQAEGLSVSDWVQAMSSGHAAKAADAYRRGQDAGRQEGDAAGYQRGRAEGEQVAGLAGFRAGLLASGFAADQGSHYDASTVAQRLVEHPEQRAIAEHLIPADYQRDWARLVRTTDQGQRAAAAAQERGCQHPVGRRAVRRRPRDHLSRGRFLGRIFDISTSAGRLGAVEDARRVWQDLAGRHRRDGGRLGVTLLRCQAGGHSSTSFSSAAHKARHPRACCAKEPSAGSSADSSSSDRASPRKEKATIPWSSRRRSAHHRNTATTATSQAASTPSTKARAGVTSIGGTSGPPGGGQCARVPVGRTRVNTRGRCRPGRHTGRLPAGRRRTYTTPGSGTQDRRRLGAQGAGGQALQNDSGEGGAMGATNGSTGVTRAILYARVSTDRQAERYGLDAQQRMLRERAVQRGYEVVRDGDTDVFSDDESAKDLNRPAWRRLERAAEQGLADVLVTLDPDRLSRDLADMLMVERRMQNQGLRLEFITQEFEASSLGRAFFQIRGVFAELERNTIRERTERGRREKARQGKVVLPQNLPVWLRSADGGATVQADDHWGPLVTRAFRLCAEGATVYAIARRFEADGIAPPNGGRYWAESTLNYWLRHPSAKGTYHQLTLQAVAPQKRKTESGAKTARKRRPADQWAPPIAVPAVVDEATWSAVQERLSRNKALAMRNARRFYLLSGLVRCDCCGHPLTGHTKGGHRYYQCSHRSTYYNRPLEPEERCDAPWVRADWLEEAVWSRVAGLFRDPERLRTELATRRDEGSPTRTAAEGELASVRRRLTTIPAEEDRLARALARGIMPEDVVGRNMETLKRERLAALTREVSLTRGLADLAVRTRKILNTVADARIGGERLGPFAIYG